MPKNKFVMQSEWEDSVEKRWPKEYKRKDGVKTSRYLVNWNESVNKEIDNKQKQEQEKLEQQKLKDLKQKELQKASSSSTNTEQFPTKETGAIPKRRKNKEEKDEQYLHKQKEQRFKENEEQRAKQKAEELQKEQEQYYSKLKEILGVHSKNVRCKIAGILISGIARIYCKEKKLKVACIKHMAQKEYKEFKVILKPYINSYYIYFVLDYLLDKNYMAINWENLSSQLKELFKNDLGQFTKGFYFDFSQSNLGNTYNQLCSTLVKYKIDIPKSLNFKVFENEKERKIIDDLVNEFNQFYQILSTSLSLEDNYINFHDRQNQETACKFLEYAMKKSGYEEKIDKVLKELTKQHQPSPSSSVEEASTKQDSYACSKS